MARHFTQAQHASLRALLGAAPGDGAEALAHRPPVPFRDVQRLLALPELPHVHLLSEDTWLLGGRLLRWLTHDTRPGGDYDLFCASFQALERTARHMLSTGYTPCRRHVATAWGPWLRDRVQGRDDHAPCKEATPTEEAALQERLRLRRFPDAGRCTRWSCTRRKETCSSSCTSRPSSPGAATPWASSWPSRT
ncbi:hypothetical protein [Corallococcus sp. 4LFB]|uniref:hypothetical protein n=1 Tax=Corallococcus sp. 4LFB TaxID=3383249 RepID=UPI003974E371